MQHTLVVGSAWKVYNTVAAKTPCSQTCAGIWSHQTRLVSSFLCCLDSLPLPGTNCTAAVLLLRQGAACLQLLLLLILPPWLIPLTQSYLWSSDTHDISAVVLLYRLPCCFCLWWATGTHVTSRLSVLVEESITMCIHGPDHELHQLDIKETSPTSHLGHICKYSTALGGYCMLFVAIHAKVSSQILPQAHLFKYLRVHLHNLLAPGEVELASGPPRGPDPAAAVVTPCCRHGAHGCALVCFRSTIDAVWMFYLCWFCL